MTLLKQSLMVITILSAPFFLTAFIIGLVLSFFLSLFQISEGALLFIPKWLAALFIFAISFPWLLKIWSKYIHELLLLEWNLVFTAAA